MSANETPQGAPEIAPQSEFPSVIPTGIPVALRRVPSWGVLDILLIVFFSVCALTVVSAAGLLVAPRFPAFRGVSRPDILANPIFLVPVQALTYLFAFLLARMLITLRAQEDFWAAIKWNFPQARDMFTFVFTGVVLAFATQMIGHFLPVPKDLPVDEYFSQPSFVYLMMAFGLLVAPLAEETLFRGLIFPVAARSLGLIFGTIVTAFLFALIHQGQLAHAWAPLLLLFGVGLVLTAIRAIAKSVAASWIVHFCYNATLFALLLYTTGGLRHLERLNQ